MTRSFDCVRCPAHRVARVVTGIAALGLLVTTPGRAAAEVVARLALAQDAWPALTVTADAGASTASGSTIASYRFDFGDGSPPVVATAPRARHTYANPGTYAVTLTVTDDDGDVSAPRTETIVVDRSWSPVEVFAGYYDTHHPGRPQPKPSPWRGSAGVLFVGTPDPGTINGWDSSAIRIDNLTDAELTGVEVVVRIGAKRYALWGTNSIPAGQSLILAQTDYENFDGSDTSPAGCYGCDPALCLSAVSSTRPVIEVRVNGTLREFVDTLQVLNTRGVDGAGCPYTGERNDESTAWTRVAWRRAGGSAFLPAPAAASPFLAPVRPNPTHGEIQIDFALARRGAVRLGVYDLQGRLVKPYVDEVLEAGAYRGYLELGGLPAGVYFCRLTTPEGAIQRKFLFTR